MGDLELVTAASLVLVGIVLGSASMADGPGQRVSARHYFAFIGASVLRCAWAPAVLAADSFADLIWLLPFSAVTTILGSRGMDAVRQEVDDG